MACPSRSSDAPAAGYSGTPLAKKLGIGAGQAVCVLGAPPHYEALLAPVPPGVRFAARLTAGVPFVHAFVTSRAQLEATLARVRGRLAPAGTLWISWPKRAAKVPTDVTEDVVRALALPLGLVDVKVCAVDAVWSALKLVIRRELRDATGGRARGAGR
jgi:hypothetical protein